MSTIHVGNLSFTLGEKDLEDYFSKYGKVVDSYIVRRGGRPRGYGFVEFSASKEADNALSANGEEMNGRVINIELAKGKIVKSNFQEDGDDDGDNRNNNSGGFRNNNNGGFRNNNSGGGFRNNNSGGFRNNNSGGGFRNNNDGGYRNNNDGGFRNDNDGGYRNNNDGGFRNNNGGYRNNNRGPRQPRVFNRGGKNFYTLRSPGGNRTNADWNNNGPSRGNNNRRSDAEKEKSLTSVYVSNLPFSFDEKELANLFGDYKVKTAHIVTRGGRSKGFGFVEFETEGDQDAAFKDMDHFVLKGSVGAERTLSVKASLFDKQSETETTVDEQTGGDVSGKKW
jgi:RNA recognition motif-containing protein